MRWPLALPEVRFKRKTHKYDESSLKSLSGVTSRIVSWIFSLKSCPLLGSEKVCHYAVDCMHSTAVATSTLEDERKDRWLLAGDCVVWWEMCWVVTSKHCCCVTSQSLVLDMTYCTRASCKSCLLCGHTRGAQEEKLKLGKSSARLKAAFQAFY